MYFSLWFSSPVTHVAAKHPGCTTAYSLHPFRMDINLFSHILLQFPSVSIRGSARMEQSLPQDCTLGQARSGGQEVDTSTDTQPDEESGERCHPQQGNVDFGEGGKMFSPKGNLWWCYKKSLTAEKIGKVSKWTRMFGNFSRKTILSEFANCSTPGYFVWLKLIPSSKINCFSSSPW